MSPRKRSAIIAHFKKVDPVLYGAVSNPKMLDKHRKVDDLFAGLCRIIIGQQLSVKAAASIFQKFDTLFRGGITPQKIQRIAPERLRAVGLSNAKVRFIKDLAKHFIQHKLTGASLKKMSDEEVRRTLLPIHGIGPWSVDMFLIFYLEHDDVFAPGDLGLTIAIKRLYKLRKDPDHKKLLVISKKWTPYRSHACKILWNSLDNGELV